MRILALKSTGMTGSVALLEDEHVTQEIVLREDQRSAQSLAPAIQQAMQSADWPVESIELIAIAVGPGSFTGLRVGITTAKMLAYAINSEVIGLDTLAVIAEQARSLAGTAKIHAVLDAQRNEVFVATFQQSPESIELICTRETHILGNAAWLATLVPGDVVSGPGLRKLQAKLPADVLLVDQANWDPRATTIGELGRRAYLSGRRDDLLQLAPRYHRLSYAEEKSLPVE